MTVKRNCSVFVLILLALIGCLPTLLAQTPVELQPPLKTPFTFVAYGDSRFHDPKDFEAANPPVRQALVKAIAKRPRGLEHQAAKQPSNRE